jgi:hypothetical protein
MGTSFSVSDLTIHRLRALRRGWPRPSLHWTMAATQSSRLTMTGLKQSLFNCQIRGVWMCD